LFEVKDTDLAGRIGKISAGSRTFETPAFLPVVHPARQEISASKMSSMGFEAVITNSYITNRKFGREAVERGIHNIIGFDGVVMTDSGGYQALMYGSVDVDPVYMAEYQRDIKADIAVILDLPTGYPASRERAEYTVRETLRAARRTQPVLVSKPPLWVGPVQGGAHADLLGMCAKEVSKMPFDIFAIGSPVEIMNGYNFDVLASIICEAKAHLPLEKPVHLFGAAHPLTIALAVAFGCDLFDSASYVLFAKQDRYMTPHGVRHVNEMAYLTCSCPVCSSHTAKSLCELPKAQRTEALALHNLYILKSEVDSAKQAIKEGRLWEHASQKARSHPKLAEGMRFSRKMMELMLQGTPVTKAKALLLFDAADFDRPELVRSREAMASACKPRTKSAAVLLTTRAGERFFGSVPDLLQVAFAYRFDIHLFRPFFGIVPLALYGDYPISQSVMPKTVDDGVLERSIECASAFLKQRAYGRITLLTDSEYSPVAKKLARACRGRVVTIGPKYEAELRKLAPSLGVH
jgi:7-cyano-7-deazaguanine tRNA-ribosyltransferase